MHATSVLSIALLALAGWLLDAHREESRRVRHGAGPDGPSRVDRRRLRRRLTANVSIAAVGLLFAVWPLVPREPVWVAGFTFTLTSLAMLILSMGVTDAIATVQLGRRELRSQLDEQAALLESIARSAASGSSAPHRDATLGD